MEEEKKDHSSDGRNICNTYVKFVFENLEDVQMKLHRLIELEREARTLLQELASEELIIKSEIRW